MSNPAPNRPADTETLMVITRRFDPVPGIAVIEFADPAGAPLAPCEPGSHIAVTVSEGLVRQYSLCTLPGQTGRYRIAVLDDPASRGGSRSIHATFQPGKTVAISAPRNHFPLHAGEGKALLLGGGIGITPILAMAYQLRDQGREFDLLYTVRSRSIAGFLDELGEFGERVRVHADDENAGAFLDIPNLLALQPEGTHLYVCGPGGFMDAAINAARTAGWPEGRIHFEYFGAEVEVGGAEFEVEARKSGRSVIVGPDETIIAALERIDIRLKKSCEQGVCGTCICDVIEGEIDHRDKYLTNEEREDGDQIVACCSRGRGKRLVLNV